MLTSYDSMDDALCYTAMKTKRGYSHSCYVLKEVIEIRMKYHKQQSYSTIVYRSISHLPASFYTFHSAQNASKPRIMYGITDDLGSILIYKLSVQPEVANTYSLTSMHTCRSTYSLTCRALIIEPRTMAQNCNRYRYISKTGERVIQSTQYFKACRLLIGYDYHYSISATIKRKLSHVIDRTPVQLGATVSDLINAPL